MTHLTPWAAKGKEPRPNTNKRKPHKTHPHEAGSRHNHTCQQRRPANRQPRTTYLYQFSERDGTKGPPAGNKARCNCTNTPQSKATRHKAKPNQTPRTHRRGARHAWTISANGRARPGIGVRPAARFVMYAPDRHRDELPRQRATLSSRSTPRRRRPERGQARQPAPPSRQVLEQR
jgi:hypothetical protein